MLTELCADDKMLTGDAATATVIDSEYLRKKHDLLAVHTCRLQSPTRVMLVSH